MVQQSLVEYVQKLLSQGYSKETIRNTILNAGYSPSHVEIALRASAQKKVIGTKVLVIAFASILVIALIILITTILLKKEPAQVTFTVSPFSTHVNPGGQIVATAIIKNPERAETRGTIESRVTRGGRSITSTSQTLTFKDRASIPIRLTIPKTAGSGSYSLNILLRFNGQGLTESIPFTVSEAEVQEPTYIPEDETEKVEEEQLVCPGDCDDFDACTDDVCIQGVCRHTPKTPCCRNDKCENGETTDNCGVDCGGRISPDDIIAKAEKQAATDSDEATSQCQQIGQQFYVDKCLSGVAQASNKKEICKQIADAEVRDSCLISFAYENDFAVCDEISNTYMQNSCYSLKTLTEMQR